MGFALRRRLSYLLTLSLIVAYGRIGAQGAPAQLPPTPVNDLPNPYKSVEGWAKMPEGRTWGSTSAVDIDKNGTSIWVGERCGVNNCVGSKLDPILLFDASGALVRSFGSGMILSPHGLHVDRDGNVWITDCTCTVGGGVRGRGGRGPDSTATGRGGRGADSAGRGRAATPTSAPPAVDPTKGHQIYKFSPEGKLLLTLGKPGGARDPDFFWQPNDVLVAPGGEIYVSEGHSSAEGSTGRILKFSKDGILVASWGKFGKGPDEYDQPHALAMDSKGRLFVGDRGNNRIKILDQEGKLLETWYQFSRPSGIWIDKNDIIYVADSESGSVNPAHGDWKRGIRIGNAKTGAVTGFIPDPNDKATNTSSAEGVAVDSKGNIYGAQVMPRALMRYERKP